MPSPSRHRKLLSLLAILHVCFPLLVSAQVIIRERVELKPQRKNAAARLALMARGVSVELKATPSDAGMRWGIVHSVCDTIPQDQFPYFAVGTGLTVIQPAKAGKYGFGLQFRLSDTPDGKGEVRVRIAAGETLLVDTVAEFTGDPRNMFSTTWGIELRTPSAQRFELNTAERCPEL